MFLSLGETIQLFGKQSWMVVTGMGVKVGRVGRRERHLPLLASAPHLLWFEIDLHLIFMEEKMGKSLDF